jgi:large subunit ribosomal protein L29
VKIEKIRELKDEELQTRADELEEEIFRSRVQKETGQLDQMGKVRNLRRFLARVKTVLRERRVEKAS